MKLPEVTLPGSNRQSSRLGYGTGSLMGRLGRGPSTALLEAAYEAGIRHFDTAPAYGFGQAERVLGDFLRDKPDATVATKYGILPVSSSRTIGLCRHVIGRFVPLPAKRPPQGPRFSAAGLRASLEQSLRKLRRERVELFLLHEPAAEELTDDSVLRALEDAVKAGKAGCFGVASGRQQIAGLQQMRASYCGVLQSEWTVFEAAPQERPFTVHHSTLTRGLAAIQQKLVNQEEIYRPILEGTGRDIADKETLAALMLRAAIEENPNGMTLFASKNAGHIRKNAEIACDQALGEAARTFYRLLQDGRVSA